MIHLKNLYKSFQNSPATFSALKNINLKIQKGQFIVIKGQSGSGKSTLLHILAAIMKPTSGEVNIEGENIASLSDIHSSWYRKNKIGYITQNFYLFDELSVQENLLASLVIQDLTYAQIEEQIERALESAHILDKKEQIANTLSGGEKQRCIIARALVNNAEIIICDEPTANLDTKNSLLFLETLKRLKDEGKTIILSTHDMVFDDLECVDKVFTLSEGELG